MVAVSIVGDGPGGLSAALFLAKNGHEVTVFGDDASAMHYAYLHNYLGIPEVSGSDFQRVARGQTEAYGATIDPRRVASVATTADGVTLTTEDGATHDAAYLVLSEGKNPELARALGLEFEDAAIVTDRDQRTSLPRVYAVGRSTRPTRSQAIISAGAGAAAALDILAREAGNDVQDWDTPPKS
ncbi:MAG: FAD-dependent oxidoreductase [Acidimicrobiia bacterium]